METQIELAPERSGGGGERAPDDATPRVVRLSGFLSDAGAADLVGALDDVLRVHGTVVADVSGLTLTDPAAVRAFSDVLEGVGEWPDVRLALAAPDPTMAAALAESGVVARVPVHPDVPTALARVADRPALTHALWHFSVTTRAPAEARGHVRRVCSRWDVGDEVREAAEIVVTELVTNAVEHAGSSSVVHAERSDDAFRLTVRDYDRAPLPHVALPDASSARGRGLAMVAAVTQAWGVRPHDDGKSIWAEMSTTARA